MKWTTETEYETINLETGEIIMKRTQPYKTTKKLVKTKTEIQNGKGKKTNTYRCEPTNQLELF